MKESEKQKIKEKAESWGCKINDEVSFYKHYIGYRSLVGMCIGLEFLILFVILFGV